MECPAASWRQASASSPNHPNIAAIYGVVEADAHRGLVLEFVEGPTLADRLAAGPLSLDDTLTIAHQIAEALAAAHDHGIIHRDLKPANIKAAPGGIVKVLDFGLAKIDAVDDGDTAELSHSPMATVGSTRAGVILGTAAYMSPDQARGKAVDKRTDIWSFGCVLYEMLTGRAVFCGETDSDTIASILTREPDWTAVPETTPLAVRRMLQRCLDRDPQQRLRDIGELKHELDQALDDLRTPTAASGATPTSTTSSMRGAGRRPSRGPMVAWRSSAARMADTSSSARSSRIRRCSRPASTCTAIPRSPRASGTATDRDGWTCSR